MLDGALHPHAHMYISQCVRQVYRVVEPVAYSKSTKHSAKLSNEQLATDHTRLAASLAGAACLLGHRARMFTILCPPETSDRETCG